VAVTLAWNVVGRGTCLAGVNPGDSIVVKGPETLKDGQGVVN